MPPKKGKRVFRETVSAKDVSLEVEERDVGWDEIKKILTENVRNSFVKIGVVGKDAEAKHEDGITNARLAAVHEFGATIRHPGGTPYRVTSKGAVFVKKDSPGAGMLPKTKPHLIRIPARSFIGSTFDKQRKEYEKAVINGLKKVVDRKLNPKQLLGLIGLKMVADVKNAITQGAGILPPNAPSTFRRKLKKGARSGSSSKEPPRVLVDEGLLVGSITHVVEMAKKSGGKK